VIVVTTRNPHQALPEVCYQLSHNAVEEDTRNGPVYRMDVPLTVHYLRPLERVIFWPERDANPFFHLFEAMWMLMGRNDVDFVEQFAKNMRNYSDDGKILHGAYGHRWRHHFGLDQLGQIIENLKKNSNCRRQVLQMWDARSDMSREGKDVPCNTQIYFQRDPSNERQLNMMVTNRSNDIIWGMLGSNAVHFSVLLEYVAESAAMLPGQYWHVSFNPHIYKDPHGVLSGQMAGHAPDFGGRVTCPYSADQVRWFPLMSLQTNRWQRELEALFQTGKYENLRDPFITEVLGPMWDAWHVYKTGEPGCYRQAQAHVGRVVATDWKRACWEWLERRRVKHAA
jgi:hypothetical protein